MKKSYQFFLLILIITLLGGTSCSAPTFKPESELWGRWAYQSNEKGNPAYFYDIEFNQDGSLIINEEGSAEFAVIAPGRMKITQSGFSGVFNYEFSGEALKIYFDQGYNQYERVSIENAEIQQPPARTPLAGLSSTPTQENVLVEALEELFADRKVITPENADQVLQLERWGKGRIHEIAYSPDGKYLALASSIGIYFYTVPDLKEIRFIDTGSYIISLAFSPDGRTLASGSWDKTIRLWESASGTLLRTLEGHTNRVSSLAFSPDGRTLTSGSYDGTTRIWGIP